MLVLGHLRQVAVSAAHAELALLRSAPALLEALCQHWHCLAVSKHSCTASSGYLEHPHQLSSSGSSSSSSSSSSNRLAAFHDTCSPNPSIHPHSRNPQNRSLSSSATITEFAGSQDSSSSCSSTDGQGQQQQQQQQRQDAYRRGFGAKVALPSTDVLHEVLAAHAATIKLRAYHIGARIHIGQVLQHAQQQGCRTNSGKDYCIIWPPSKLNPAATAMDKRTEHTAPRVGGTVVNDSSTGKSDSSSSSSTTSSSSSSSPPGEPKHMQQLRQLLYAFVTTPIQSKAASRLSQQLWQWVHDRQAAAAVRGMPRHALPDVWRKRTAVTQQQVEPLLVVYRVGSVVFLGSQQQAEAALLDEFVPQRMRYKAGGDSAWTRTYRVLQPASPAEEHVIKVVPGQGELVAKGTDQVLLRVLDVGGVRVITSVLAQSAALKFYETSVAEALDRLASYRAMVRSFSKVQHSSWAARAVAAAMFRFSWLGEQERTFFKVVAASALVISEARGLLEMAEPAWNYAAYHSIWAITAEDCELEARLKALEVKLRQVEKEAKHDVKDRAGRRYHRLEQSVVWLLVVSCMLAALEVGKKAVRKREAAPSSSSSSSGSGVGGCKGASSVVVQVDDGADGSSYRLQDGADASAAAASGVPLDAAGADA